LEKDEVSYEVGDDKFDHARFAPVGAPVVLIFRKVVRNATTLRVLLTVLDGTCTFADVQVRNAASPVRARTMPKTVVYKRNQSGTGNSHDALLNELGDHSIRANRFGRFQAGRGGIRDAPNRALRQSALSRCSYQKSLLVDATRSDQ